MISNSGHDENGRYSNGRAGDQTGTEWYIRGWYSYPYGGWQYVLRHPDPKVRAMITKLSKEAAANNNIGYDQAARLTYWMQLKASQYDPSKIKKKCEADCSAGVTANVKAAGYRLNNQKLKELPHDLYTGNMRSYFGKAGFQILSDLKYRLSDKYLLAGDILLNERNHTCVNITDGSKAHQKEVPYPTDYLYKGVSNKEEVKKLQRCLNKIMKSGLEVDGIFGNLTYKAVKKFQKKYKLEVDGIVGPKTRAMIKKVM